MPITIVCFSVICILWCWLVGVGVLCSVPVAKYTFSWYYHISSLDIQHGPCQIRSFTRLSSFIALSVSRLSLPGLTCFAQTLRPFLASSKDSDAPSITAYLPRYMEQRPSADFGAHLLVMVAGVTRSLRPASLAFSEDLCTTTRDLQLAILSWERLYLHHGLVPHLLMGLPILPA